MRNLIKGHCSHFIWNSKFDLSTNNSGMGADEMDTEAKHERSAEFNELLMGSQKTGCNPTWG